MAENNEAVTPMIKVMAKPLIALPPKANRMAAVINEVTCESKIAENALSYEASMAFLRDLPPRISSRKRS